MGSGNNLAQTNKPPNRLAAGGSFPDEASNFVITNRSDQKTNERQVFSAYRTRVITLGCVAASRIGNPGAAHCPLTFVYNESLLLSSNIRKRY
jgi:hypothetical protein